MSGRALGNLARCDGSQGAERGLNGQRLCPIEFEGGKRAYPARRCCPKSPTGAVFRRLRRVLRFPARPARPDRRQVSRPSAVPSRFWIGRDRAIPAGPNAAFSKCVGALEVPVCKWIAESCEPATRRGGFLATAECCSRARRTCRKRAEQRQVGLAAQKQDAFRIAGGKAAEVSPIVVTSSALVAVLAPRGIEGNFVVGCLEACRNQAPSRQRDVDAVQVEMPTQPLVGRVAMKPPGGQESVAVIPQAQVYRSRRERQKFLLYESSSGLA